MRVGSLMSCGHLALMNLGYYQPGYSILYNRMVRCQFTGELGH